MYTLKLPRELVVKETYNVVVLGLLTAVEEGCQSGCGRGGVPGVTSWISLAKRDNPCRARQSHMTKILRQVPRYYKVSALTRSFFANTLRNPLSDRPRFFFFFPCPDAILYGLPR